jgi:hypothetical protein
VIAGPPARSNCAPESNSGMLHRGFDVRTVQRWMGHKSLETTMCYLAPATDVHDELDLVTIPSVGKTIALGGLWTETCIAAVRHCYFAALTSKRSRFITLTQEFTKSFVKRSCPSDSA